MSIFSFLSGKSTHHTPQVSYSGGTGGSVDDAVVINATSSLIGVPAEYQYVAKLCGRQNVDWKLGKQYLLDNQPNGRAMDLIEIELKDGSVRQFYFDITSFFGRF